jgi:nucleoside-diphosphate-sugar epimerase
MADTAYLTGASGFVGRNLLDLLPGLGVGRITTVGRQGADLDYDGFARTELEPGSVVVHLAGKAHDLAGQVDETEYQRANVDLTERVFETFRSSAATSFVFLSSVKAVADTVDGALTEDHPAEPRTAYGRSKLAAERLLTQRAPTRGQRVYVLRPCLMHGPGVKGNLALLDALVRRGVPFPLGGFHGRRSLLSVDNLAFVIDKAASGELPGGTYNVADDDPLTSSDMVRVLAEAHGRRARVLSVRPSLVRAVARVGDTLSLPLDTVRLTKLTESYVVSNRRLLEALELDRLPHPSAQTLRAAVTHSDRRR